MRIAQCPLLPNSDRCADTGPGLGLRTPVIVKQIELSAKLALSVMLSPARTSPCSGATPWSGQQQCFRRDDLAVFAIHVRQRHRMNFFSAAKDSAIVAAGERESSILDQIRVETQIASHPDRRLHRIVRDDPGNRESGYASASETLFQVGADERVIGLLSDDGLAIRRPRFGFECVPGLVGAIGRDRLNRIVPNMKYRARAAPPLF
jgi:hypothetical protein